MKTAEKLVHRVAVGFPGFEKTASLGMPQIFSFSDRSCEEWYSEGVRPVFRALGENRHFPVFRMSHGELHLALGVRLRPDASMKEKIAYRYRRALVALGLRPPHREFSAGAGTAEEFSSAELQRARSRYVPALRNIAAEGLLAGCFQTNPGYIEYFPDFFHWLDQEKIPLTPLNYIPFYSVYAMIFGPDGSRLFDGRRILIINYLPEEKKRALSSEFFRRRVESVQFMNIRPDKALFETIDLNQIKRPVDLVLVGAGCGAAPIADQIRPLAAVVIDAGFAIDALANPDVRWHRPFCIPDDEFELEKVRFRTFG